MDLEFEQFLPFGREIVRTIRLALEQVKKTRESIQPSLEVEFDPVLREVRADMHERMVFVLKHVYFMLRSSELDKVGNTVCPDARSWSWCSTSDDKIIATCIVPRDGITPKQADEMDAPRKAAQAKVSEALAEMRSARQRGDDGAADAANRRWREAEQQCRKYAQSAWTGRHYSMEEIEAAWRLMSPEKRPLPPLTEVRKAASFQRMAKWRDRRHRQRIKYLRENGTDIGPPPGEDDMPDEAGELRRLIPLHVTEPAVAAVGRTIWPEGRNWWLVEKGRGVETEYEATCMIPRDGKTAAQADAADRCSDQRSSRGSHLSIGWEARVVPFIEMAKAWERMPEAERPYADWDGDRSAFRWGVGHPAEIVRRTLGQIGRGSDIPTFDQWYEQLTRSAADEDEWILRKFDAQIKEVELKLRLLISTELQDDPEGLPSHVRKKITERLRTAWRTTPGFDMKEYETLLSQLEFADLRELQDTITNKEIWPRFASRCRSKEGTITRFSQLAQLRNGIRHSRQVNDIVRKDGEAAILWFQEAMASDLSQTA